MVQAYPYACATHSRSVLGPVAVLRCANPDIAPKYFSCSTLWITASLFLYKTKQHSCLGVIWPHLSQFHPWQVHPLLSLHEAGSTSPSAVPEGFRLSSKHKPLPPSQDICGERQGMPPGHERHFRALPEGKRDNFLPHLNVFKKSRLSFIYICV